MEPNMDAQDRNKYVQPLTLERGGKVLRRPRARTPAEIALDERMRLAYIRCLGRRGTVPSRGVQEIRQGRQAPWRAPARRVIEMLDAGVPVPDIKLAVALELAAWIDDLVNVPDRAA
jgi:hypothetical protein